MAQLAITRPLAESDLNHHLGDTQFAPASRTKPRANGGLSRVIGDRRACSRRSVASSKPVPTLPA